MQLIKEIVIPMSRLRRELNKWFRHLNKFPFETIVITRRKEKVGALVSNTLMTKFLK